MDAIIGFCLAIAVSAALSSAILAALIRPVKLILSELCAGANGARFWVVFTAVMLYIAPLLVTVMMQDPRGPDPWLETVRGAMTSSLFAAVAALLVVGWKLARVRPVLPERRVSPNANEFWGGEPRP
ncbi:MAG: hypothetical protein ACRETX_12455 [Steroidobacteraceae bacterium]